MATWIVRISPKNKISTRDWENLLTESESNRHVAWDKDYKNRIKTGDEIGFIVGETGGERIVFYDIAGELSTSNRSSYWSSQIYTHSQVVEHDISLREVIILDTYTCRDYVYEDYKQSVGYSAKYTPRGTTRARPMK